MIGLSCPLIRVVVDPSDMVGNLAPLRFLVVLLLLLGASLGASCSGTTGQPEKRFPSGEPAAYEIQERMKENAGELASDTEDMTEEEPARHGISVPAGKDEQNGLTLSVSIETRRVKGGTRIPAYIILRNTTGIAAAVKYPTDQRFDVIIFEDKEQKKPVHVWSQGRFFNPLYSERMLGPGANIADTLEVSTTGDPVANEMLPDDLSRPLTPGTYYLWATNAGDPYLAAGPVEIVVE